MKTKMKTKNLIVGGGFAAMAIAKVLRDKGEEFSVFSETLYDTYEPTIGNNFGELFMGKIEAMPTNNSANSFIERVLTYLALNGEQFGAFTINPDGIYYPSQNMAGASGGVSLRNHPRGIEAVEDFVKNFSGKVSKPKPKQTMHDWIYENFPKLYVDLAIKPVFEKRFCCKMSSVLASAYSRFILSVDEHMKNETSFVAIQPHTLLYAMQSILDLKVDLGLLYEIDVENKLAYFKDTSRGIDFEEAGDDYIEVSYEKLFFTSPVMELSRAIKDGIGGLRSAVLMSCNQTRLFLKSFAFEEPVIPDNIPFGYLGDEDDQASFFVDLKRWMNSSANKIAFYVYNGDDVATLFPISISNRMSLEVDRIAGGDSMKIGDSEAYDESSFIAYGDAIVTQRSRQTIEAFKTSLIDEDVYLVGRYATNSIMNFVEELKDAELAYDASSRNVDYSTKEDYIATAWAYES